MKKIFIIVPAILFLAAACNNQVVVEPTPNQPTQNEPTGQEASFSGQLIAGGAECQLFQADNGKQYTLTGNLAGFKEGDKVNIKGTLQEISFCQQGDGTISVSTITK